MRRGIAAIIVVMAAWTAASGGAAAQAPGAALRDCAECPQMVVVPGGTFVMGAPDSEDQNNRNMSEGPQHRVTIRRFAIGRTHVTRGEFAAFVQASGYRPASDCRDALLEFNRSNYPPPEEASWQAPGFAQTDRHPVVCIAWNDAQAYARWLAERTRQPYRLPTEAEWEYAARAGTRTPRYWGNALRATCRNANVRDLTYAQRFDRMVDFEIFPCRDGFAATAPGARLQPNRFGLYDMLGNAWQWVEDCLPENFHEQEAYVGAPTDGSAWRPGDCALHVLRGGSWGSVPQAFRVAMRGSGTLTERHNSVGFRIARSLAR
jgi:formylglycine-generating enzyme required for sulfatase activity